MPWYLDPTLRTVAAGGAMIGAVSGSLGVFAYLRRQSLIADVVAHSSLLGIMIAFLISYALTGRGIRTAAVLMPGAIVTGLAAAWLTQFLTARTRIKEDAALGIMLAIFFASAMVLLRMIERADPPIDGRAGLNEFLFGQAAATTRSDLVWIASVGVLAIGGVMAVWPRLKIFSFDPDHAASLGLVAGPIQSLLSALLVVGIVIGLQSVGVILMIAMLTAPAAAARQWTRGVGSMVCVAAGIGAVTATAGAIISGTARHAPTGPIIVLLLTAVFGLSLLIAPRRGVLARWNHRRRVASRIGRSASDGPVAT